MSVEHSDSLLRNDTAKHIREARRALYNTNRQPPESDWMPFIVLIVVAFIGLIMMGVTYGDCNDKGLSPKMKKAYDALKKDSNDGQFSVSVRCYHA